MYNLSHLPIILEFLRQKGIHPAPGASAQNPWSIKTQNDLADDIRRRQQGPLESVGYLSDPSIKAPTSKSTPKTDRAQELLTKLRTTQEELIDILRSGPKLESPVKPTMPAYRTEDAVKGGLGLLLAKALGGNDAAANFAHSYVGQKNNLANLKTQSATQRSAFRNQQAAEDYNRKLAAKQAEVGFREQDMVLPGIDSDSPSLGQIQAVFQRLLETNPDAAGQLEQWFRDARMYF